MSALYFVYVNKCAKDKINVYHHHVNYETEIKIK